MITGRVCGLCRHLRRPPRLCPVKLQKKAASTSPPTICADKRLLPIDSDKVSSIELTVKKQSIIFGRSKDEWQIVKPKPFARTVPKWTELLRTLRDGKNGFNFK